MKTLQRLLAYLVLSVLSVVSVVPVQASVTNYVAPAALGGNNANTGLSAAQPWLITKGVLHLTNGNTILALPGNYTNLGSYLAIYYRTNTSTLRATLRSQHKWAAIIEQSPAMGIEMYLSYGIDIVGFHVRSNTTYGVICTDSDVRLIDCWIDWNQKEGASFNTGGGLSRSNKFIRNLITNNGRITNSSGIFGHGLYVNGDFNELTGNTIRSNWGAGIQLYSGTASTTNAENLIANNFTSHNGQGGRPDSRGLILYSSMPDESIGCTNWVIGCTFLDGVAFSGGHPRMSNCIVLGSPYDGVAVTTNTSPRVASYQQDYNLGTNVLAGPGGSHNVVVDGTTITRAMLFPGLANGQYWLTRTNAARYAAHPTTCWSNDFFSRPQTQVTDIGGAQYDEALESDDLNRTSVAENDYWLAPPRFVRVTAAPGKHTLRFVGSPLSINNYYWTYRRLGAGAYSFLANVDNEPMDYRDDVTSALTHSSNYTYRVAMVNPIGDQRSPYSLGASITCDKLAVIHPTRLLSWGSSFVGVPGGIPATYTNFCNIAVSIPGTNIVADPTEVADSQPAFMAAWNRCPSNAFILVPAGRYRFNTNLTLLGDKKILRGVGALTVLVPYFTNTAATFISFGSFSQQGTDRTNVVDVAIGATNTTWDAVNGLGVTFPGVGGMFHLRANNASVAGGFAPVSDGSADPVHYVEPPPTKTSASVGLIRQMFTVTGTNTGNRVYFTPAAQYNFASNSTLSRFYYIYTLRDSGLEDFRMELRGNVSIGVNFVQGQRSWIKGVSSTVAGKAHIAHSYSLQCEIIDCDLRAATGYGPNQGIGIHLESHVTGVMVKNNICVSNHPAIEVYLGIAAPVIAYNYFLSCQGGLSPIDIHNAHNFLGLVQGNVCYGFVQDGYSGSAEEWTLFRNWFHGEEPAYGARKIVNLDHFTRDFNIVGNVVGNPRTNWTDENIVSNWNNTNTVRWRLGFPNMGNDTFTGTNSTISATTYDYLDFYVSSNLIKHANIEYGSIGSWVTNYQAGLTNRTLPPSYFTDWDSVYPPTWWTNAGYFLCTWPPIGPDVAGHTNLIPAMVRYHQIAAVVVPPPTPTVDSYDDEFMRVLQWFFFPWITLFNR